MKRRNENRTGRGGKLLGSAKPAEIREAIEVVKVWFPRALVPILNTASARLGLTRPQFIRAAMREKLERNGVRLPAPIEGDSAALLREKGAAYEVDPIIHSSRQLTVQDMGADRDQARRPSCATSGAL